MLYEFLLWTMCVLAILLVAGAISDGHMARAAHALGDRLAWLSWCAYRRTSRTANVMYLTPGLTSRGMRVVNALDALAWRFRRPVMHHPYVVARARAEAAMCR